MNGGSAPGSRRASSNLFAAPEVGGEGELVTRMLEGNLDEYQIDCGVVCGNLSIRVIE